MQSAQQQSRREGGEHCVKSTVEWFLVERDHSECPQNTALFLEEESRLPAVVPGGRAVAEGCGTRLSLLTCASVHQLVSGGRKRKALGRDAEGTASKTFPV